MTEKRKTLLPVLTGEMRVKAETAGPIKGSPGAQKTEFGCVKKS